MKKFELTNETINVANKKLFRIRALKDFGNVKAGDLGGYIESENNLSQENNCWIYHKAKVYDDARVYENARVFDTAEVFGNAEVYENAVVYRNDRVFGNDRVYGGVKNLVPKNLHNENNLKEEKMTNKRTEELFNNLITYIVELVGGVEYVGTLKDSIGFTDDELMECGIDLNDIEEYNRK